MSSTLHRLSGRYSDGHSAAVREVVLLWGEDQELHLYLPLLHESDAVTELDRWPLAELKIDDFSDGVIAIRWERSGTPLHPVVEVPKSIAGTLIEAIEEAEKRAAQATPAPWDDLRALTPRRWRGAVVAGLFLAVALGGTWLTYRAVSGASVLVPRSWERRVFKDLSKVAERGHCRAPMVESVLRDWWRTLPSEVSLLFTSVVVHRSCGLNAFVLPGDHLMVCRGMLELGARHPDEFIGVLAHEAGHLQRRHLIKHVARNQLTELLAGFIGGVTGTSFFLGESIAAIGGLKFSRDEETEADRVAAQWLHGAGWGTQALVSGLSRLRSESAKAGNSAGPAEILSTHPDLDGRIDGLREYGLELERTRGPRPETPVITENDRKELLQALQQDCGR